MNDDRNRVYTMPGAWIACSHWTNEQRFRIMSLLDRQAHDEKHKKERRRLFRARDAVIRLYRRAKMH